MLAITSRAVTGRLSEKLASARRRNSHVVASTTRQDSASPGTSRSSWSIRTSVSKMARNAASLGVTLWKCGSSDDGSCASPIARSRAPALPARSTSPLTAAPIRCTPSPL